MQYGRRWALTAPKFCLTCGDAVESACRRHPYAEVAEVAESLVRANMGG